MLISCTASHPDDPTMLPDLARYRNAGCDAIQLAHTRREPRSIIAALRSANLRLSGVDLGCSGATATPEGTAAMADLNLLMKWAKTVGSDSVCLLAGARRGQSWEVLVASLQGLLSAADTHDLYVDLMNARDTAVEQIEDLRRLVADVRHPRLRLAVDTGEFHASAVNARDVLAEFADLVGCIRVSDRIGKRRVPLGQGEVNLQRIVEKAGECGCQGWFVLDACEERCGGAGDALAEAVAYLKTLE